MSSEDDMSCEEKRKTDVFKESPFFETLKVYELRKQQADETRGLWKSCFPEDSEEFLDYYYAEKTKDNRILVGETSGKIVSMLHRNPYGVVIKGRHMPLDYIVAVATQKEYRGMGCMRKLLSAALLAMNREGQAFTYLMPAAEAIYTPYGFRYIGDGLNICLSQKAWDTLQTVPVKENEDDCAKAAALMNQWLSAFDVHTRRDASYVRRLIRELACEKGALYYLVNGEKTFGLWAQWGLEKREQRLCYTDHSHIENIHRQPLIMGRITNVETFLPIFGLSKSAPVLNLELVLNITDPLIFENNGTFIWTLYAGGSVLRRMDESADEGTYPERKLSQRNEVRTLHTDISDLALWLFGRRTPQTLWKDEPYECLEALNWVDVIHRVYLDEIV